MKKRQPSQKLVRKWTNQRIEVMRQQSDFELEVEDRHIKQAIRIKYDIDVADWQMGIVKVQQKTMENYPAKHATLEIIKRSFEPGQLRKRHGIKLSRKQSVV